MVTPGLPSKSKDTGLIQMDSPLLFKVTRTLCFSFQGTKKCKVTKLIRTLESSRTSITSIKA